MWRSTLVLMVGVLAMSPVVEAQPVVTPNPILFVTQVPTGAYGGVEVAFGNHRPGPDLAPRGGDLVIRYPDGSLRFLTAEAGYGNSGQQGANAIAVREPSVHWSGTKALFSMALGAPTQQYQVKTFYWQIYEVSGLGVGETATIHKIANQPATFNNVSPIYGTDDKILFISDRPPSGAAHHYPQLDEYESDAVVAGIYSLDEASGVLTILEHAPSGVFSLSLDSSGKLIFTKWDHLQRDQQGDAPATAAAYEAFTYASEDANAAKSSTLAGAEVFPEPRTQNDPAYNPALSLHSFNHFFPWELNEDGTAEETLNHIGRHELGGAYTDGSFKNDPNLTYYTSPSLHANQLRINGSAGLFHFREDPANLGEFLTTYAPEFSTATGGTLMRLTASPGLNAEDMVLTAVTPTSADAQVPQATGYFRNPLPMVDGTLIAVHTPATGNIVNLGTTAAPNWSYSFRLKKLTLQGNFYAPSADVTAGLSKNITFWTPDVLATHSGPLWELDPVEVMARPVPVPRTSELPAIEANVFAEEGVNPDTFRDFLRDNGLALIVSRNITQRDRADVQQPFNLQVPGGVSSIAKPGTVYDVSYLQVFQGDAVRGYGPLASPDPGRRLLARPMHAAGVSETPPGAPAGGVGIAADGSFAALVPAQRALTWQLTDQNGGGVVRERNWISFQSGEIRVCGSCHGINTLSQTNQSEPTNEPQALHDLLAVWKQENGGGPPTSTPTPSVEPTATPTLPESSCAGAAVISARLHAAGPVPKMMIRANAVVPKPWQMVDPPSNGVRITVAGVLDVLVPGGPAWSVNPNGTRWSFRDATGAFGGVTRIDVLDRSGKQDGALMVVARIAGGFSVPAPAPLDLTISFGDAVECTTAHWNGPLAAAPRCRGGNGRISCR